MQVHLVVNFVKQVLRLSRSEIGAWCGVSESAVTKWIALSSGRPTGGRDGDPYGHEPETEHLNKMIELRREARCVEDLRIDPEKWRSLAEKKRAGKPSIWTPVWEQLVDYKCASAKHYASDDPQAAVNDLGKAMLEDDDAEFKVTIRSAELSGEADARCFGDGNSWEVLVQSGLPENRIREEALRELQAHVFHVKETPEGLPVEQPLKGVEKGSAEEGRQISVSTDPLRRRDVGQRSRTWVLKRSNVAAAQKRAIARHVATHIVRPQMLVQIASGTTENCLMDDIISNETEDIQITTNNLQVLVKGLGAAHLGISVNLIGGKLNPSIDSLVGAGAAPRKSYVPRITPPGVFGGGGLRIR
jgi:hypothetical protein